MNLIISGENPQNLAKVVALAKHLGLMVSRELAAPSSGTSKTLRSGRNIRTVESQGGRFDDPMETPSADEGPLYGIE